MIPARSHSARVDGFGRTARVMVAQEQFDFHASVCAGATSPTSAGRSDWMRCEQHAAVIVWLGVVASDAIPRFRLCSVRVCVQMTPAQRLLRAAAALEEATHTHPQRRCVLGTAAVVGISAGLGFEAVSPLRSAVMLGSARIKTQTTA